MSNQKKLPISVLTPFKDKANLTLACVNSFIEFGPPVEEILLISNNSSATELQKIKDGVSSFDNVKVVEYNHPFNYQKMNNWAAQQAKGKFILLLNNDTELVNESRGLLEKMYTEAQKPDIGMVGCVLLYGDQSTIQHAGVYLRPGSLGDHIYVGKTYKKAVSMGGKTDEFPYDITKNRKVTSVTGAVQLIERKKFNSVHGFDERFLICGGDVDLCIRLNKKGYATVLASGGYIIHKESQSRAHKPVPFVDFYYSYLSYMEGFDTKVGDPFSPKITEKMT